MYSRPSPYSAHIFVTQLADHIHIRNDSPVSASAPRSAATPQALAPALLSLPGPLLSSVQCTLLQTHSARAQLLPTAAAAATASSNAARAAGRRCSPLPLPWYLGWVG